MEPKPIDWKEHQRVVKSLADRELDVERLEREVAIRESDIKLLEHEVAMRDGDIDLLEELVELKDGVLEAQKTWSESALERPEAENDHSNKEHQKTLILGLCLFLVSLPVFLFAIETTESSGSVTYHLTADLTERPPPSSRGKLVRDIDLKHILVHDYRLRKEWAQECLSGRCPTSFRQGLTNKLSFALRSHWRYDDDICVDFRPSEYRIYLEPEQLSKMSCEEVLLYRAREILGKADVAQI